MSFRKAVGGVTALIALVAATAPESEVRDPFSGRWRLDAQTITLSNSQLTITFDGKGFGRSTGPSMDSQTPADGRFHPAKGSDYVDSIAVKIVSSNEVVETNKVKGRLAYESRYVLSEDSQTLTWKVTSYANATNAPVESSTTWRRISQDPSAAHRLAGKWQQSGVSLNGGANDWLLKMSGNVFSNRTPQGSGYTAQIGGPAVLNEGDSAGAMVSIVKPDPYTIIEYHSLKKDVRAILLLQASPEAESLKAVAIMPKTGKATSFVLRRVAQAR